MAKRRSTSDLDAKQPRKRGRQPRREHWVYAMERALGIDHSLLARLLTPEPLSVAAVRDIANSQSNTASLHGLKFPVAAKTVSDIIAGESVGWELQAQTLLFRRLGVVTEEYFQTGEILSVDGQPFGRNSLRQYLANAEKMQKNPALSALSYFS